MPVQVAEGPAAKETAATEKTAAMLVGRFFNLMGTKEGHGEGL